MLDPSSTDVDTPSVETHRVCGDSIASGYRCFAHVQVEPASKRVQAFAAPKGFGPPDLEAAYNIDPANVPTTIPTIAIVDAYGYAALESDLAMYRSTYNLPACTVANGCLTVINSNGQATPLPNDPPANDDWTVETALDVDMASAACPRCKILVVQAPDNAGQGLFDAQAAAVTKGAAVISNSWGGPEQGSVADVEPFFDHPTVGIYVAAGDDGYNDAGQGPDYPGTSTHTIAVGGTRLAKSASARGWTETAWTSGGSACSLSVTKPAYQTESPCGFKATTDVAAVGDPQTGLAVYNAKNGGWIVVGGTSASAPFVASLMAAGGNGAITTGKFFKDNAAKLNDITTGSNGTCAADGNLLCNAAAGWDGPTGYGTPDATKLSSNIVTGTGSGSGSGNPDDNGSGSSPTNPAQPGSNEIVGGCSSSGGTGGLGVGLALALVALRRRRR